MSSPTLLRFALIGAILAGVALVFAWVGGFPAELSAVVGELSECGLPSGGQLRIAGAVQIDCVGHSSGLKASEKKALVATLEPYETGERGHGDPSRWQSERELEWVSLRPELVVEVTFDHASGGRIRHGTKILRWRDDKPPVECRLEQMQS